MQDIVTDFRWRIGADLNQGYLSVASCEIDAVSGDSCDTFEQPVLQDEITEKRVAHELGLLASNREGIKKEMFDIIVKFRDNSRNGSRKLAQMKSEFCTTFLNLSGDCNCLKLKKKCGKLWSCIEYAIFENVQIESFSLSHLERMKEQHNAYLLSQMCHDSAEESLKSNSRVGKPQLVVQMPFDIGKSEILSTIDPDENSIRRSERPLFEPVQDTTLQAKSSSKSKQQNYVKIVNVDSC